MIQKSEDLFLPLVPCPLAEPEPQELDRVFAQELLLQFNIELHRKANDVR